MDLLYNYVYEDVKNNINKKMLNKSHVIKLTNKSAKYLTELNSLHVILFKEGYRSEVSPSISSLTTMTTTYTRKKIYETKTTSNTTFTTFPNFKGNIYCTVVSTKSMVYPTPNELKIKRSIKSTTTTSSWSAPAFQRRKRSNQSIY
ncbi:hypothetical protein ACTFIV_010413 [Dictyostelium citrinum]